MLKRFTIGWKILSGLSFLLLLIVGANVVIFTTQKERITLETADTLSIINNMTKSTLLETVKGMRQRAADFSSDGFIRDSVKEIITTRSRVSVDALNEHLKKNKQSLDPSIYGIDILDLSGVVIASTDQNEIGRDESTDAYYIRSEDLTYGSTHASDFESTHHFGREIISIVIAAPLTDKVTGERIGMLLNFVRVDGVTDALESLSQSLIQESPRHSTLKTFIINNDGFIISKKYIGGNKLTEHVDLNSVVVQCDKNPSYVNIEGVQVIGATLCLNNGWKVVAEIDEAQAFASIDTMRRDTVLLIVILGAFILIMMYLMTKTVIDPIKLLSDSAQKLGKGAFTLRTNIESKDELGDLSTSFNEMAENLEDSHKILERKIKEVTGDLEKFKLAVEGASDHIIITDKEGVIIYANKAAEEITGYALAEMLGNRPSLWGKQMPQEFYRAMWRTIKEQKENFHGEVTNRRKNGQLYIAESYISPLFDDKGDLYGFVGVERDITRQKEIDKSKTEFVSIASHQLRTPLTIINWYVEMLTTPESELSEKQRQYLEEITRASKRMIELVNALLNVSRIDMGTFMVDVQPLDFAKAMDELLHDLTLQITEKQLVVETHYDSSLPQINADPKLLHMVFLNLMTNAVKYTPAKGTITVNIERQEKDVFISIADTGLGIPADQQSKIFTKFFRADNARAKEPDGNGLGLYIIKSLVEHSGGKIWFESIENQGSTFYVSLPLTGMRPKQGTRPLAV